MKRCKRCNMPEGKFSVKLNADEECNYCVCFDAKKEDILKYENRKRLLLERFKKVKGQYSYDAMVGLSGGKDSTYVLYKMVKEYGLKVLALTYDNGFLTDFAKESINATVKALGVDHEYFKPDWETHKSFYKATLRSLGDPCIACAFGGYFLAIKKCTEKNIPFFVHGRSPFQMYRNLFQGTKDLFLPMIEQNMSEHHFKNLAPIYKGLNDQMKQFIFTISPDEITAQSIIGNFLVEGNDLSEQFVPEFLAYFLYEQYDEETIKKTISNALGWKRPDKDKVLGHYDCAIHDAAGFLYQQINEVNVLEPDAAVMIRFGESTKETAHELIERSISSQEEIDTSLDALCSLCEMDRAELQFQVGILKKHAVSKFESR